MAVCPAAAQEDMNGLRDGESGYGADDRLEARAAIPVPVAAADPAKKCRAQPEPPHRRAYGTSHPSFSFREVSLPPSFDNPTSAATCHQEHSSLLSGRNNSRTPAVEGRGGGAPGGGLLRIVLAGGAVALVVFAAAAAVSNGRASQGPAGGAAVREAVADFPSMVAEVCRTAVCRTHVCCVMNADCRGRAKRRLRHRLSGIICLFLLHSSLFFSNFHTYQCVPLSLQSILQRTQRITYMYCVLYPFNHIA